jgi:hypothetical protein
MKIKKILESLKVGLEYFTGVYGAVIVTAGLVGLVMSSASVVTAPLAIGAGIVALVFATYGAYKTWQNLGKEEARQQQLLLAEEGEKQAKLEMLELTKQWRAEAAAVRAQIEADAKERKGHHKHHHNGDQLILVSTKNSSFFNMSKKAKKDRALLHEVVPVSETKASSAMSVG